ncbi:aliphatic sulfonates family ABC transporter, periplasmic ligand-binding protein [Xylanimonas cellulosilytica DSM 15894]|uniref:Aliphatic sulfonates family ABC transporter, periplasmic ligand-binding protein n=1 Tax=Xylanimonas cellulosilytica (strain DSM 15894 / JCM 12276 / CECT 5975 / KCTC 9989 / LMG 20990 / NBRC 107835 / XIL07) TaxID=446471 RepID=D1BXE3_XYLCX|nr:ABC transporter substrate-binding protein [Xylanimonas cellulosilytica]ACZ29753.1 aliphatic sulfonates family ABC transporter, periplasmic ligand-binding protein [Xylanimonas cellulosilytica DSM 15894]
MKTTHRLPTALLAAACVLAMSACAGTSSATGDEGQGQGAADEVRVGYFANVTHAAALVAVGGGHFEKELGDTALKTEIFNAGPAELEALNAGAIDVAFIGPNPAINGFVKSQGQALKIVAGAASGGAQLVVRDGIDTPADLAGTKIASPQLGNTQDVALRVWLDDQGYTTDLKGGGDLAVTPTENAQTLQLFQNGELDGGWLPEPWASRLVLDAGAHVLIDEKELWPGGQFVTTNVIVRADFLAEHPETVEALLRGELAAIEALQADPVGSAKLVNDLIAEAAGKPLAQEVLDRAFANIEFTVNPLAGTLQTVIDHGVQAGTTQDADLTGIYDLRLLNKVLADNGQETVSAAGLGEE